MAELNKWAGFGEGMAGGDNLSYDFSDFEKGLAYYMGKNSAKDSANNNWTGTGGYLDLGFKGVNAAIGGVQAYTGLAALGLAKDQFGFEKSVTNRNLLNQGTMVNNAYDNSAQVGLALTGKLSSEQKAAYMDQVKQKHVDTSNIG